MKTLGNTLAERKNARWGRRARLAYAERVGDECGGELRVREVNHGLHGCGSRTCLRTLRVRRCRMFPPKQSFFGASTLPNISRRQALAQPIRVIRGSEMYNHGLRGWPSLTLGRPEGRQALAQPIRVVRGSYPFGLCDNAIPGQLLAMKVDDIADRKSRGLEVVHQLGLVFGKNLLYGFQFKDDLVATDEIGDVLLRKGLVAEVDCQVLFPLEGDLVLPEGDGERFLVDWLEKSGAEFVEDGKAGAEDLGGEFFENQHGGVLSVGVDVNHGLRGWPSLTLGRPEGRQALAQPIRVIRGSNLQRLDRLRVEEERHDADKGYAFLVHPRLFIGVASNDDFAEVVSRVGQGECFLRPLLFIGNRKGGLDVDAFGGLVDDKVDFMTSHFVLPVGKYIVGYLADVNRITATDELVVNRVLHQMRALVLSKSQRGVAQTAVSSIVLERRVKIVVAFDVESLGLCKHEGVDEEVQVFGNGNTVGLDSHDGLDGIRQFRRIRGAADVAHGCCSQRIQKYVVFEPIPFGDVTKVNGFVKIRKVSHLLVRGLAQHTPRKTAEIEVFVKDGVEVAGGFAQGEEFRHGKRRELDDISASAEFGRNVGGKHFRVGSCDINVDLGQLLQSAQRTVEGEECVFRFVRREFGDINSLEWDFLTKLNFIDEHIRPFTVMFDPRFDCFAKELWVEKSGVLYLFKVNFEDVVCEDTVVQKMLFEEFSQEVALATAAKSGDDLDRTIVLGGDKLSKVVVSFYDHGTLAFVCMINIMFCKAVVLYHNFKLRSRNTFNSRADAQKFKAMKWAA